MHLLGDFTDCYFLLLFTVFKTRDKILKTVFRFTKPEIVAKIPKILEKKDAIIIKDLHLQSNFKFKAG